MFVNVKKGSIVSDTPRMGHRRGVGYIYISIPTYSVLVTVNLR